MNDKKDMNLIVDYLSFTIKREDFFGDFDKNSVDPLDMIRIFSQSFYFGDCDFMERKMKGGWSCGYYSNGISFAYGWRDDIYIEMSGSGCRMWETLNPGYAWTDFITYLKNTYETLHFARLDIACDTFHTMDLNKIQKYTSEERFISRFRTYLVNKGNRESAVYFGSTKSNFRLRIYDKTMERLNQVSPEDAHLVPSGWVRFEFQMRNETAQSFIREWLIYQNLSVVYFGIMSNHLNFVKKRESNLTRSIVTPWWSKFIGNQGKIKLAYQGGLEYNIQKLQKYVFGQAGASIKTWLELNDYNFEKMQDIIENKQLNQRQRSLIALENTRELLKALEKLDTK